MPSSSPLETKQFSFCSTGLLGQFFTRVAASIVVCANKLDPTRINASKLWRHKHASYLQDASHIERNRGSITQRTREAGRINSLPGPAIRPHDNLCDARLRRDTDVITDRLGISGPPNKQPTRSKESEDHSARTMPRARSSRCRSVVLPATVAARIFAAHGDDLAESAVR